MTADKDTEALIERLKHEAYAMHVAPSGDVIGETLHAHNWSDKPHRVLYDAVKLIEEAATALRAQQDRIKALETENAQQFDEIHELQTAPWPQWALKVLRVIRERSGYDGYDDATEGVDLPGELDECMSEIETRTETAEAKLAEAMRMLDETAEWIRYLPVPTDGATGMLMKIWASRALMQKMEGGADAAA